MKGIVFFILTYYIVHVVNTLKPKQVNLQLETILKFDKSNKKNDLTVIDQIQNFLQKIKNAMHSRSGRRRSKSEVTFTDFILEAAEILKDFNDGDLEDTFAIIDDETKKYIYKETKLQELFDNRDVRRYISDQLDVIKDMPAEMLRRQIDKAINTIKDNKRSEKYNILDIVDNLYEGASDELQKALTNLNKIRKSNTLDLENILKDTLRSLVFDHYSKLRPNVKSELISMIKHYWRAFSEKKTTPRHRFNLKRWSDFDAHKLNSTKIGSKGKGKSFLLDLNFNRDEKQNKREEPFNDLTRTHKKHKLSLIDAGYEDSIEEKGLKEIELKSESFIDTTEIVPEKKHHGKHKSNQRFGFTKGLNSKEDNDEIRYRGVLNSVEDKLIRTRNFLGNALLSKKTSELSNRERAKQKEKEFVINHSNVFNVGLGRRNDGKLNISLERSKTDVLANYSKDSEEENARKAFFISDEGISIEKFEKHNTPMRKSNVNDTFETDTKSNASADVHKMIEHLERRIEDVEEQVQFVKSLNVGADDRQNQPKFKAMASKENLGNAPFAKTGFKGINSGSLERFNEDYLFNNGPENVTVENATFRPHPSVDKITNHDATSSPMTADNNLNRHDNNSEVQTEVRHDMVNEANQGDASPTDGKKLDGNESTYMPPNIKMEDYKNSIVPFASDDTTINFTEKFNGEQPQILNFVK